MGELQSRWYALLYNAEISRVAIAAMRNLHPDLVAAVQQQALYSTAEEELLGTLPSVGSVLNVVYKNNNNILISINIKKIYTTKIYLIII